MSDDTTSTAADRQKRDQAAEAWWKACAKETVSEREWQARQRQARHGS